MISALFTWTPNAQANTRRKTTWPIPPAAPRTETLNPAPCCWFGTSAPAEAIHRSGLAVPTRLLPGTLLNGFRCPLCIWAKAATARKHRTRHKTTLVALPPRGPMVSAIRPVGRPGSLEVIFGHDLLTSSTFGRSSAAYGGTWGGKPLQKSP
jgi:hypothetical protein